MSATAYKTNLSYRIAEAEAGPKLRLMENMKQSLAGEIFRPWNAEGLQRHDSVNSAHSGDLTKSKPNSRAKSKSSKAKALAAKARAEAREREKASSQG